MENYVGEIRVFAGNFAPADWAFCNGQLLNINDNQALFYLLGTTYGGDGTNTFALPNLQSRIAVGQGAGTGLAPYSIGAVAGVESVTLTSNNLAQHQHPFAGAVSVMTGGSPQNGPGGAFFSDQAGSNYDPGASNKTLAANAVSGQMTPAGGSQPHPNIQPVLALNYIIALTGIFPSQP
jgi:microcystin-dependent protein